MVAGIILFWIVAIVLASIWQKRHPAQAHPGAALRSWLRRASWPAAIATGLVLGVLLGFGEYYSGESFHRPGRGLTLYVVINAAILLAGTIYIRVRRRDDATG